MTGLVCVGLRKAYAGRLVVDGVSLSVGPGHVHGLLGPNGAGKTTAFRLIAGVEAADAGTVTLDDEALDGLPLHRRARRGLAYLPQEQTLFQDLTVRGNVALACEAVRAPLRPDDLLARVGIVSLAERRVSGLSGGERRRLEIARLLALSPRALLLDEPFAGIDPVAVAGLQRLVRAIAAGGVAVLITDHAVRETLAICDQATVVDSGVVQVQGTPAVVAADPHARARYLGDEFVLAPRVPDLLQEGGRTDIILE